MIKNYIIALIFILLIPQSGISQDNDRSKFSSISKRKLSMDQSVPSLLQEAENMMIKDTEGALDKVEEALALSITQKSTFNEASCYVQLGRINQVIKEWELAVENYNNAYQRLKTDYRQTLEFNRTISGLVDVLIELNKYDQALQYLAIKLETVTEPNAIAETHLKIAEVYYSMNNDTEAASFIQKAERIINKNELQLLKSRAQAIKAKILARANDVESAEELYQQSQSNSYNLENDNIVENEASFETSKEALINAYQRQDRIGDEINLRNQSIASNKLKGNSLKVVKEKQVLSKTFIQAGRTLSAIRELVDAVEMADSLGNNQELANAYRSLAEAWDQAGNAEKAIQYYQDYAAVLDKVKDETELLDQKKESILKKQQDILSLTKEFAFDESQYELEKTSAQLQANRLRLQQLVIYGLIFLLCAAVLAVWLIYRNAQRSKIRGQLLALKSLRTQMNPHFIFNALNSVNQFIAINDERAANKFLSEFSKLMRLVLDNSQLDFISLADEKEILSLYLKLEHNRFREKFDYELHIDEEISLESIEVPPMLIQPYIENAIWHGLRYKEEKGYLKVNIKLDNGVLMIEITDNGIGRAKSIELKTAHQKKHHSTGLKNIEERINIINQVYRKKYAVTVSNVNENGSGTYVLLTLPQYEKL